MRFTIRKVPRKLDQALRRKARREGRSVNEIAIEALSLGAGISGTIIQNHELDFAIGSWVEDPAFDKAIEDQRRIDSDVSK
jgi:hypothetical protein